MKKKNILLTGASGTVGFEVLKQLAVLNNEYDITVFDLWSKKNIKKFKPFTGIATFIYGDISKKTDVEKVVIDKDVVIHLAAIIPPLADDYPELAEKVNVGGTANLIDALEKKSPNAFLLYSSSISVYGDRLLQPYIKVGDTLKPSIGDEYAKTKIKCEHLLQSSKLNYTIFRLSAIMGGHKISKLMFHMPLETKMEIATPADTARAFVKGVEKKEALAGHIFNLGGGEQCRIIYRNFLKRSFKIFGLGTLSFPKEAFATANFHCGYYTDGDTLENILHFRQDNLESYFAGVKKSITALQRSATLLVKSIVKRALLKQSEPLHAIQQNNKALVERFFGLRGAFML